MTFVIFFILAVCYAALNGLIYISPSRLGFTQKWVKPNLVLTVAVAALTAITTTLSPEMVVRWWDVGLVVGMTASFAAAVMSSHVWRI